MVTPRAALVASKVNIRKPLLRFLAISSLAGGFLAAGVAPGSAAPAPPPPTPPATCADIHAANPAAPDGNYTLVDGGKAVPVYCFDMAGTPREYLNLANTGTNTNFSQYTAGGASPGTNVRTTFTKLRIDPATLTVDIGDLTFATSTGSLNHGGTPVTSMPYGVAMSCTDAADGVGNIDLTGTPFSVTDGFNVGGFDASGTAIPSPDNKVIDLTGGGFCGWITPNPPMFNPFNPQPGNFVLTLADSSVPTSTTLQVNPNPGKQGNPVNLHAQVSPSTATGTVEFFDGPTSLGTASVHDGDAILHTSALTPGTHSLTATFTPTDSTAVGASTATTTLTVLPRG
jgi:hypothetical protein